MGKKLIDRNKIIHAFLKASFDKSAGATSLSDVANILGVKKASLYNHFSSREEMYAATLTFCAEYVANVSFLPEPHEKYFSYSLETAVTKIITSYFRSYELDPLCAAYSFIQSGRYFNEQALQASYNQMHTIVDGISTVLYAHAKTHQSEVDAKKEITFRAVVIADIVTVHLNKMLLHRKDMIRKNPETGTGSLFELPVYKDELQAALSHIQRFIVCSEAP